MRLATGATNIFNDCTYFAVFQITITPKVAETEKLTIKYQIKQTSFYSVSQK